MGLKYDLLSRDETLNMVFSCSKKRECFVRADLNVSTVISSKYDDEILDYINTSDLVNVDGMGVIYGLNVLGCETPVRYTGVDFMLDVLERANHEKGTVYFFGASQIVLELLIKKVSFLYPSLVIVGSQNGYIDFCNDAGRIVDEINDISPDFLFVGIKSPEKEQFIRNYKSRLNVGVVAGVGGSFDVISGKVKRAPAWMQKYGLEWLYRVIQEPKRMWKRYLVTNSAFALLLIKAKLGIIK